MGPGVPPKVMKSDFCSTTTLPGGAALPFVISTGPGFPASRCWQRPRVRFSFKENRMQSIGATDLHRKSGGAPKERSGEISEWMLCLGNVFPCCALNLAARAGGL
jgi:hypothetical protein